MTENKFQISPNISFPKQTDSFEDKCKMSYGLAIGNAISSSWFYRGGSDATSVCRFYFQQGNFLERRRYANGEIDMSKYFNKLGTNGSVDLLNLSRKSLSTIPKNVDLVVNGMCDREHTIGANSIDPVSQDEKIAYRKSIETDMLAVDVIEKTKETFGQDIGVMPIDQLPKNKEELDLHMQLEWKPSCELSAELAVRMVMEENQFDATIDRQIKRDLVVDGLSCVENRFNGAKGTVLKRIDPINMVWSETKDPYFRDCFYKGHYERVLLSDIFVEFPDLLDDENKQVKEQIQNSGEWWNTYHGLNDSGLKGHACLLYFTYKTYRENFTKIKEKKTGEKSISKAKADFDESKPVNKTDEYKRYSKVEEVLFEGIMVLGTNIMLKWEVSKSMARPQSNTQKVMEKYNMVAPNFENGKITSLVSRMIPIEDKLNIIELKAEQIIQGITPDGVAIDVDALAELDLGEGKGTMSQFDQYLMYLQKGSYFYRSYTSSGDLNQANQPFKEIRTGDSINKLKALRSESMGYLLQLTDVIGLNKAVDASNPDKDALVGVQKMAALNSNTATRHILKGAGYITLQTGYSVLYRVQDILKYYPSLKEDLIRKVGATSIEDLDYIKNLHLQDFGLYLTLNQDDEEKAILNQDLTLAMQAGQIGLSDKYKVLNVKVFKQAVAYLGVLIEKRSKLTEEQKKREFEYQAQANLKASLEAEKAKQETVQMEAQIKSALQTALSEGEIKKEMVRGEEDRKTLDMKIQGDIVVAQIQGGVAREKLEFSETKKDERSLSEATMQSKNAYSKERGLPPNDFVAEEAGMEAFELPL